MVLLPMLIRFPYSQHQKHCDVSRSDSIDDLVLLPLFHQDDVDENEKVVGIGVDVDAVNDDDFDEIDCWAVALAQQHWNSNAFDHY